MFLMENLSFFRVPKFLHFFKTIENICFVACTKTKSQATSRNQLTTYGPKAEVESGNSIIRRDAG